MRDQFKFADQLDVADKTVLLRIDVNVPLADGLVSNDTRIRRVMPGVRILLDNGAKVVILTHFGRPKGDCSLSKRAASGKSDEQNSWPTSARRE